MILRHYFEEKKMADFQEDSLSNLTHRIIGAAFEVHNNLRSGFQEVIYQRALAHEFTLRGIVAERECELPVYYKGEMVGARRVDFLVENQVCVELKAIAELNESHIAQTYSYVEAFNKEIALLINFGAASVQHRRIHNKKFRKTD
ncbi:MAG: GxxExxY protein [Candidatus Kapabacteria bacterium]|jgi:GxxExxY protein|nr:GxxExxY protein [Candidatus Kapabacteria bacterium]